MRDEELKELAKMECAKLLKSEKGYNSLSFQEFWAEGVKYGLSEGKPKWHDLRKNPDDLPQRSGLYCVQCGEVREFDKEEKSWFTVNFDPCMNCTEETYLWCELPKFEENENDRN